MWDGAPCERSYPLVMTFIMSMMVYVRGAAGVLLSSVSKRVPRRAKAFSVLWVFHWYRARSWSVNKFLSGCPR